MPCELCLNHNATRQRYILEADGMILRWLCEACIAEDEERCKSACATIPRGIS